MADSPAQLPKRWTLHANGPSGFTVGVPPDWAVAEHGEASLLFSPGRLVVVSITADRTDEALRAPLSDLTNETARHLSGFNEVVPTAVAGFAGRYPGAELTATATRTSGERQRLTLIVMRGGGAVFSLLAAATDRLKPAVGRTIGGKIARTLRYRPVEVTS